MLLTDSLSLLAIMAILTIIRKCGGKEFSEIIFFEVIRSWISITSFHPYKSPLERLVMVGFVCFCFLVNTIIQSRTTSILTRVSYYPDIDTIEQFYQSEQSLFTFRDKIEEINKIFNGNVYYSGISSRLQAVPDFVSNLEVLRDSLYQLDMEEMHMEPFIINHDRGVFLTRIRKYRKNGIQLA